MQDPGEVMRRLCLAYPWSAECKAIAPIRPTPEENQGLWHGESGYDYAVGKNVPRGTQCESVQLVPYENILKSKMSSADIASSMAASPFHQLPPPLEQNTNFSNIFPFLLAARKRSIHSFI